MYAQITLVGNVGQDPESRQTASGKPMCTFSVAVNHTWRNESGEHQKTTWYDIVTFERQAEACLKYVKQGDRLLIVSENIDSTGWNDREGNVRSRVRLVPRTVRFLTPRSQQGAPEEIVADAPEGSGEIHF